jgi:UDP-N-acetylmuramoyl-L-alanyl-D-glutamate--2,6-diaminopimelate ligase
MKLLKDILYGTPLLDVVGSTNVAVASLAFDSRKVEKESLFVAIKGTESDGHDYIDMAIEKGARSVVCEKIPEEQHEKVTYMQVRDSHETLGKLSSNFYDNPSEKLKIIAVTGTNGKTTTATLLYSLFQALDHKSGLLSTVNIRIGKETVAATHTTPDPISINIHLKKMVEAGCKYCFMEASSHGLAQKRTAGLKITGAVFTNISHDHLDYHKTFDDYILAKKLLFDGLSADAFALVNADDRHGFTMLHHTKAKTYSFALKNDADFKTRILEHQLDGMLLKMGTHELWTKLIGTFNAYNILAIYAVALLLKQDELQVVTAISNLKSVEGRFEYIKSPEGTTAIIDYAHTPDALKNVLQTIKTIRGGANQVITVVGCGGNRDKSTRPEMAKIATNLSDRVVLTSDNPRHEDPDAIINDMEAGVEVHLKNRYISITNREQAIKTAVQLSTPGDIILIAGKGHEKYQDVAGEKKPFDDFAMAQQYLNPTPA